MSYISVLCSIEYDIINGIHIIILSSKNNHQPSRKVSYLPTGLCGLLVLVASTSTSTSTSRSKQEELGLGNIMMRGWSWEGLGNC